MGDRPPGLDTPRYDGGCFNCGSRDHFAYACPEPVRKEPYGAEVFRQRQAAKTMPSNRGKASPNERSKGLVITRYAPPPGQYPPPLQPPPNVWGAPGGPYPPPALPPNPYTQQPPQPPYPPANPGQPPYPPPYQVTNPPVGSYPPPIPPPPGPGPAYGQYPQPSYPPPPSQSYGPPGPYGPPTYPPTYQPPTAPYSGAPPLNYPGLPPQAPPPPTFPPSYGAPFPPGPPPAPPVSFSPAPYGSGYQPPAPYSNPYPPPPNQGWQQIANGPNQSRHRDHRDRDRRNDRDRGGRNKHPGRGNDRNQRGGDHRRPAPAQRSASSSRPRSPRPTSEVRDVKEKSVEKVVEKSVEIHKVDKTADEAVDIDDEFAWGLENAFVEVETKPADPVGKPLDKEWNDDPTIPPAYNAKCIKSAFYDPDIPGAFGLSIRESKQWSTVKRDPIFRYRRGMLVVRFPGSKNEYFTYHCSRKVGKEWYDEREIIPTGPSDPALNDSIKPRTSLRAASALKEEQPGTPKVNNGKRGLGDADHHKLETKRPRNYETSDYSPLPRRPDRSPARTLDVDNDPWAPQPGETHSRSPFRPLSRDRHSRSPGIYRLQKEEVRKGHFSPRDATQRYDSGYQSAYSGDRPKSYRGRSHSQHLSPPPSRRGRDDHRDRDRSRSERSPRKWSPSYPRAQSRTRSASPLAVASDAESGEMSDLDFELLGLERPERRKKKKATPAKPAVKRRQVKLNDAFGRRW